MAVRTLITGALVVTMDAADRVIEGGAVLVEGGKIERVGPVSDFAQLDQVRLETVNASGHILMPGLVNGHTHMGDSLFRGLVEDLPLEPWLERLWVSERQFLSYDTVRLGADLAIAEMIRGGITSALDMFWFPEAAADAAISAGFRLSTGPIMFDFEGPDGVAAEERPAHGELWLERYSGEPLIHPAVQPHQVLTVAPERIRLARQLANRHGAVFHAHCAETEAEVAGSVARFGRTPLAHLHHLGALDGAAALAHLVHLTDQDFGLLAESGAGALHNPLSNLKLGSGIAEVSRMLDRGIPVAIGTDGAVSSNDLDMWTAIRVAGLLQRGVHQDPLLTPARQTIRMATAGAADAIGLGEVTGRLTAGHRADLVLIDLDRVHLTPAFDPWPLLAYTVGRADVTDVMIEGTWVMRGRKLLTVDPAAAVAGARELGHRIAAHNTAHVAAHSGGADGRSES